MATTLLPDPTKLKASRAKRHCAHGRNEPCESSWARQKVDVPSAKLPKAPFVSSALDAASHFAHQCASASLACARSGKLWLDKNARPQLQTVWYTVRSDLGDCMCAARKFALVNVQRLRSGRPWLKAHGRRPTKILARSRISAVPARQRIRIANRSRIVEPDSERVREESLRYAQTRDAPLDDGSNTLTPQINELPVAVPSGPFVLQPLPWLVGALAPVLSSRSIQIHHGCHYAACIALANQLSRNHQELAGKSALDIVLWAREHERGSELFAATAEAWNHALFWKSLTPSKQRPQGELSQAIDRAFGDFASFADELASAGAAHVGSGWLWLVASRRKQVKILVTAGAAAPEYRDGVCLLAIDLWEHAYYFDHQNRRREYLDAVIDRRLDWQFAETRFRLASQGIENGRRGSRRQRPRNGDG
jgi:Fe-Mn family superoxide dismutase